MFFFLVFNINENIIKIYYHKNIKFLRQNLIDIALKRDQCVSQFKRHYLVLKMAVAGPKDHLPFIFFPNLHPMIDIS